MACVLFVAQGCKTSNFDKAAAELGATVVEQADACLAEEPVTVTASCCERSAGGVHDFYSEGDYWWPDPENPDGPYIRRDGETNPGNFVEHRHAMIRFSQIVGSLTSAYLLTGDQKYVERIEDHLRAWFMESDTYMTPNLLYGQAIKGVATGRSIGVIDTIQLMEVSQSLCRLEELGALTEEVLEGSRKWFADYLEWMCTHPYGTKERDAHNNHGTCWAMQAASFAKFTGNQEVLDLCRSKFKDVFMVDQLAQDGSFPEELARTKPYGYSLFNLDAMATICQILSTPEDNLWEYATEDGKTMVQAVEFMYPFVADKGSWPYSPDIMFWEEWPVAQPAFLFAWAATGDEKYFNVWAAYDHNPTNDEVIRNLPVRNPLIWM